MRMKGNFLGLALFSLLSLVACGTPAPNPTPGGPPGAVTSVMALAAGELHSLALLSNGTVMAWGANDDGQLGNGTFLDAATPAPTLVGDGAGGHLTGVKMIAAGDDHSLALLEDGTVMAWGENDHGQLGDGTDVDRAYPVQVSGLDGVVAVAAGDSHTVALRANGEVWAWGSNTYGQLGIDDGSLPESFTPVRVAKVADSLPPAKAIAAGEDHVLALLEDGSVYSWGNNTDGQIGSGSPTPTRSYGPVRTSKIADSLPAAIGVAAGEDHSLAMLEGGGVVAWGEGFYGQLGDGGEDNRLSPNEIAQFAGVTIRSLGAGDSHSLVVDGDGAVWAWGRNNAGQVGNGSHTTALLPVRLTAFDGEEPAVQIAGGESHSLALLQDGTVLAWGGNDMGQLGTGDTNERTQPTLVTGLP